MATQLRRLCSLTVMALALVVAVAIPVVASQAASDAESTMLGLLNAERTERDLIAVRWDSRLADVAQDRSNDMAENHYFGHLPPAKLAAMVADEGIVYYKLGEILAKNDWPTMADSAKAAVEQWKDSPAHWSIIKDAAYNYVAVGVTAEPGTDNKIWTVLFLRGPDRTGAKAWMTGSTMGAVSGGARSVTVKWDGRDVRLSALTAGLKDFTLQKRRPGGTWSNVASGMSDRKRTVLLTVGQRMEFRVQARDRNGNRGAWSTALSIAP
jgi:uncharacterized protein YkwD